MFEVVRQPGLIQLLVGRPDLVGDHRRDDRRARYRLEEHPQPVGKGLGSDALVETLGGLEEFGVVGRGR
jgi:hypothetical protein